MWQKALDDATPFVVGRWAAFAAVLLLYFVRILFLQVDSRRGTTLSVAAIRFLFSSLINPSISYSYLFLRPHSLLS
jgi:hypothetical protein